jgi:hypothetical protein
MAPIKTDTARWPATIYGQCQMHCIKWVAAVCQLTSVVKFVGQGYQNVGYQSAGDESEDEHFSLEVVVAGEADENSNKEYYSAHQLGKS